MQAVAREFGRLQVAVSVAQMRADRHGEHYSVWSLDGRYLVLEGTQPTQLMKGRAKLVQIIVPHEVA